MGEISDTIVKTTEFSGDYKMQILTATLATKSDTIVLTEAANKISEIVYAKAHITSGADTTFAHLQTSYSTLTITIKSFNGSGADATTWGNIEVLVIGK